MLPARVVLLVAGLLTVTIGAPGCAGKRASTAEETFTTANEYFETGAYQVSVETSKELLDNPQVQNLLPVNPEVRKLLKERN